MLRHDGRSSDMRALRFVPNSLKHADGSVLVEYGDTRSCTVCIKDGVPNFLRNSSPAQGWLTANIRCYQAQSIRVLAEKGLLFWPVTRNTASNRPRSWDYRLN